MAGTKDDDERKRLIEKEAEIFGKTMGFATTPTPEQMERTISMKVNVQPEAEPTDATVRIAQPIVPTQPKQAQPKQAQPKQAQPKQAQPKQAQPRQAQPKQAQPRQAQPKQAQPKQAQPKQAQPKQAQPKQAQPKQAQPKKPPEPELDQELDELDALLREAALELPEEEAAEPEPAPKPEEEFDLDLALESFELPEIESEPARKSEEASPTREEPEDLDFADLTLSDLEPANPPVKAGREEAPGPAPTKAEAAETEKIGQPVSAPAGSQEADELGLDSEEIQLTEEQIAAAKEEVEERIEARDDHESTITEEAYDFALTHRAPQPKTAKKKASREQAAAPEPQPEAATPEPAAPEPAPSVPEAAHLPPQPAPKPRGAGWAVFFSLLALAGAGAAAWKAWNLDRQLSDLRMRLATLHRPAPAPVPADLSRRIDALEKQLEGLSGLIGGSLAADAKKPGASKARLPITPSTKPEKPAPPPSPGWAVNITSVTSKEAADSELARLKSLGIEAEAKPAKIGETTWYRIRLAGFARKADADAKARELSEKLGIKDIWVSRAE